MTMQKNHQQIKHGHTIKPHNINGRAHRDEKPIDQPLTTNYRVIRLDVPAGMRVQQ
jgi:hypothetical protein